jgi:hypothetical protein
MIAKVITESQRDWDEHIPMIMSAYRGTVHESTGFTPNFLLFGRENRMPVDVIMASLDDPKEECPSGAEYAAELVDRLRRAYKTARNNLKKAAETRKRNYDVRVKPQEFKEGEWVFYLYQRRFKGRSPKWASAYTGPFRIVKLLPPCNVVLAKNRRSNRFVVHKDKLKKFYGDPPKDWPLDEVQHDLTKSEGPAEQVAVPPAVNIESELNVSDETEPKQLSSDSEGSELEQDTDDEVVVSEDNAVHPPTPADFQPPSDDEIEVNGRRPQRNRRAPARYRE